MLDERLEVLLSELLDGGYKTAGNLAEKMNLSEKSVRTRIKELGTICIANGAVLRSKQRYGYCLEIVDQARFQEFLDENRKNTNGLGLTTPDDRVKYLLNELLSTQTYVKMDDLAEKMFISRQTLVHDLRKAEVILSRYGLIVEKKSRYGMKVLGQELGIRRCISEHLSKQYDAGSESELLRLILDILKQFRLEIAETSLKELYLYAEISKKRMEQGFFIRMQEGTAFIKGRTEYRAASAMAAEMAGKGAIVIPESEILYLAVMMAGNRTFAAAGWEDTNFVIPQYLDELVERMVNTVYETFALDYRHNLELRMALNYHLVPMDIRLRYQLKIQNPMLDDIRKNYLFPYTVASQAVIPLREYYHCAISDEETGYIALQFALAMERDKTGIQKKKILMVCSSGQGSAQLLKYKYMEEFGKYIEEIRICTVYQLEDLEFDDIDYVLTTVPVKHKIPRPIMEIQTFLSDREILKIREKLQENEMDFLNEYYSRELFFPNLDGNSKEEVIAAMCEKISRFRTLPPKFYESVLKREDLAHTDYGNLVALPHPYKMMTDTTFVGVGILKKPIYWVQNQVQVVLLVSLAEGKHPRTQEFYKITTALLLKEEAIRELIEQPEFPVFMRLLKEG